MRHSPYTLFIFQALAHLSLVPMILYGHAWQWGVALLIYFLNGCIGMTMTYHRQLSHQSFLAPAWFKSVGLLCATIGLTGSALSWVAIHREHHRYTDTEKDPHAPKFKGWFHAHFLSMFVKIKPRYVRDLIRDRLLVFQHEYYYHINIVYASILYLIDPFAIVYAWLVPAAVLWNGGSSIVSLSHRHGTAHNDLPFALLVWGEGYHVNHHQHPDATRFGRWDLAGWMIDSLFTESSKVQKRLTVDAEN